MKPDSDVIASPTKGQLVADSIRRKIILGDFRDGDFLPSEAELSEQYRVSRPVLREACRILQWEGLLTIRRGSKGGARINSPRPDHIGRQAASLLQYSRATIFDVFRTRCIIEPVAARLLAESHTPAVIQRLHEALDHEGEALAEPLTCGRAHSEFHVLLVELSSSNTLALFARIMADITTAHTNAVLEDAGSDDGQARRDAELAHRVHQKVAHLIEERNGAAAEAMWRAHMAETTEKMLKTQGAREVLDLIS
jgi:DNA-binding FadR family transcriptional regulator